MRRRCLLVWSICAILLGGMRAAVAEDPSAGDVLMLRKAGIATNDDGLLSFFRERTSGVADEKHIRALIRQMGDDKFKVRQQASRRLVHLGVRARPFLQSATEDKDLEIARRARECLRRIREGPSALLVSAAVRILARSKPPQAAAVLLAYLPNADDDKVAETIRQSLTALAVRDGKAEPALIAALSDKSAIVRAAAAVALANAALPEVMPSVRKLLDDRDPLVRSRLARVLVAKRDKDAMPALLRSLDELPLRDIEPIIDMLERLAGKTLPPVVYGSDAAAHRQYRQAWQTWWKKHQADIEPARLEEVSQPAGRTLVVLLDLGVIEDLDSANRVQWKIEKNIEKPLDVQLLPGEKRVLIAEYEGNRVSERNLEGKIVWKYDIAGPLAAQRLPNGNTFIATQSHLLEVDHDGKEVFHYTRPDGAAFMRAAKQRNGDIVCIVNLGVQRFVRLKPDGRGFKEVKSWGVQVGTSGGRIDVLANDHVLIPEMFNNCVVEYDAEGEIVWKAAVDRPIAAMRLANGHTLITRMERNGAVEVDRNGKEVWRFSVAGSRVTRALRR